MLVIKVITPFRGVYIPLLAREYIQKKETVGRQNLGPQKNNNIKK
jgi:hypothetical protein